MQVERPPRYDPTVQEKRLQEEVGNLIAEEKQCVASIVARQINKPRSKWPLWVIINIAILCTVENEKISDMVKKAMMTTTQIARDICTPAPTGDIQRNINQLQEQQKILQRDFALMAASLRELNGKITAGNCSEQESPLAMETQKRMEQMSITEADLAKKVQELQNAVEILGQPKKSARRPLPLLTEMESPKNYHTPTATSQAKEGKYHLVEGKMVRTEDL